MEYRPILAALAEPNRLRIVVLLAESPRSVSEIALLIGARQPQTTKHIQVLEAAGIIKVHRLGKRRIAALRRDALNGLSAWLGGLATEHPSEPVLERYERAIDLEQRRLSERDSEGARTFELQRTIDALTAEVWSAWTTAELIRRWWAPNHFEVAECEIEPEVGGTIRIVIQERDGTQYASSGMVSDLVPGRELIFSLAPLGPNEAPLFDAIHEVKLVSEDDHTTVSIVIRVSNVSNDAAPALAGIPPGWEQCLDKLEKLFAD